MLAVTVVKAVFKVPAASDKTTLAGTVPEDLSVLPDTTVYVAV